MAFDITSVITELITKTYLIAVFAFQERRNVHYYFEKDTGLWIRIPIAWELKHDLVKQLLSPMEVSKHIMHWRDLM